MNGVVAFLIALLLYPGIIAALVAAWALSWTRDIVRTSLGSGTRPGPLSVVSELRAAFARETLAPAGVEVAFQAIIPVLAVAAPLTALVLLPLPGNPLISGLGLTGDLVAEGCLLFAVPVLRLLTGWATPSPYTRLAADRGARLVAGCGLPVALALSALAQQLGTLEIGPVAAPSTTSLAPLAVVARLLAAAAFACCLPVLARVSSLREGDGDVDLAAGELSEASGRDLAAWRLAEALQLVAATAFFAAAFIQPILTATSQGLRIAAWIAVPLLAAIGVGAWEGLRGAQPATGDKPPLSWWFGPPLLLALFALVASAFAARAA